MTPDKAPNDAPWWYKLALNGSFASAVLALLFWQTIKAPSQSDTVAATIMIFDRLDKTQKDIKDNNAEIKEIFRTRAIIYEKDNSELRSSIRSMVDGAAKYHEAAEGRSVATRKIAEENLAANREVVGLLEQIRDKKKAP